MRCRYHIKSLQAIQPDWTSGLVHMRVPSRGSPCEWRSPFAMSAWHCNANEYPLTLIATGGRAALWRQQGPDDTAPAGACHIHTGLLSCPPVPKGSGARRCCTCRCSTLQPRGCFPRATTAASADTYHYTISWCTSLLLYMALGIPPLHWQALASAAPAGTRDCCTSGC